MFTHCGGGPELKGLSHQGCPHLQFPASPGGSTTGKP